MDLEFVEFVARQIYDEAVSKNQEFMDFSLVRDAYIDEARQQLSR